MYLPTRATQTRGFSFVGQRCTCNRISLYAKPLVYQAMALRDPGRRVDHLMYKVFCVMGNVIAESHPEWHHKVYRKSTSRPIPDAVKARVRERDNYHCQVIVCRSKRTLECHHIIPVINGGQADEDNLILLCKRCHDEIEDTSIRTRHEIREYIPDWYLTKHNKARKTEQKLADDEIATDWHLWVYGSGRNPRK